MRLSLRQLAYVVEVSRLGSIARAAEAMRISSSSILAAIEAAERDFGTTIFSRRPNRGTIVTSAGERFLVAARSLLTAEADFDRQLDALVTTAPPVVRVGCFEPFGPLFMTAVLKRFVDATGAAHVSLAEGDQDQLRAWLAGGQVDFVVSYDIGPDFPGSVTPICKVPTHAVLHVSDPLAARAAISIADLATRPMVLLDLPHTSSFLLTVFDVFGVRPRVSLRSRAYETVRAAVTEGFGVSVLNMRPLATTAPDSPMIVRRPIIEDVAAPTLVVADIYGETKPLFVREFITTLRRFFSDATPRGFAVTLPEREAGLLV
jgi:DNA-binding transcriptional LysR family regulator